MMCTGTASLHSIQPRFAMGGHALEFPSIAFAFGKVLSLPHAPRAAPPGFRASLTRREKR